MITEWSNRFLIMILESEFINFPESVSLSMHEYESAWRKALDNVIIFLYNFLTICKWLSKFQIAVITFLQKMKKVATPSLSGVIIYLPGCWTMMARAWEYPAFLWRLTNTHSSKFNLVKADLDQPPTNRIVSFASRFPSGSRVSGVSACLCGPLGLNLSSLL